MNTYPVDTTAMQSAFEEKYQRDWNDPASGEMVAVWADAWVAAQDTAKALLAESLAYITDKPWDDEALLHARVSAFLGFEVKYPELVNQIKAASTFVRSGETGKARVEHELLE